jgi:hypothetical protein
MASYVLWASMSQDWAVQNIVVLSMIQASAFSMVTPSSEIAVSRLLIPLQVWKKSLQEGYKLLHLHARLDVCHVSIIAISKHAAL